MQIEFFGPSLRDSDDKQGESSRLYNCYRSPRGSSVGIKAVLGMSAFGVIESFITIEVAVPEGITYVQQPVPSALCRAVGTVQGVLYVVHGGALWSVSVGGSAVNLGTIPDDVNTTISGNNGTVTVVAAGRYFVYDIAAGTLTEPAAGAFSDFGAVEFLGQRTILTERNGRRIQWSGLAAPGTLGGLDFATTESRDDRNIRAMVFGPELWIFKERSIERWATTSNGVATIPGATYDRGLLDFRLLCKLEGGGFFVASDGRAYIATPGDVQRVSVPAVETSIATETPLTCAAYNDEGHEFCVITFANRPAWCYDLNTGEWHERGQGVFGPWEITHIGRAYGHNYAIDDLGNIYKLARTNVDATGPLIREMIGQTLSNDFSRFNVPLFEVPVTAGNGGTVELSLSRDRGLTWTDPKPRSVGPVGVYDRRPTWRALGRFRTFTPRVTISDALEIVPSATATVRVE